MSTVKKTKRYKSPKIYIPNRSIITKKHVEHISPRTLLIKDKDIEQKLIPVSKDTSFKPVSKDLQKYMPLQTKMIMQKNSLFSYNIPDTKIKHKDIFKDFLCDIELFNAKDTAFDKKIIQRDLRYYKYYAYHHLYTVRKFGEDITYYSNRYFIETKTNIYVSSIEIDMTYSILKDEQQINFRKYLTQHSEINERYPSQEVKEIISNIPSYIKFNTQNIQQSIYLTFPFVLHNRNNSMFGCFYSKEIKSSPKTRYTVFYSAVMYGGNTGHAQIVFVDNHNKTIELYDPSSHLITKEFVKFINKVFNKLYPEYTIIKYWDYVGIQYVEKLTNDDTGFCATWTSIMLRLKIVNQHLTCKEITENLIKACENKKISMYELGINYNNMFDRIIKYKDNDMFSYTRINYMFNVKDDESDSIVDDVDNYVDDYYL